MVDVFGGKITTYRRLAEAAMGKLAADLPGDARGPGRRGCRCRAATFRWTARRRWRRRSRGGSPSSTPRWAGRLVRGLRHRGGGDARRGARAAGDLGERFGWDLTEREVRWLMEREWARTAEDVLWRRTKLGLRLTPAEAARLAAFLGAAQDAGGAFHA